MDSPTVARAGQGLRDDSLQPVQLELGPELLHRAGHAVEPQVLREAPEQQQEQGDHTAEEEATAPALLQERQAVRNSVLWIH